MDRDDSGRGTAGHVRDDVCALAERVFESRAAAQQFLTAPHPLLDDRRPIELAATAAGARRVEAILWRLEYSLPV